MMYIFTQEVEGSFFVELQQLGLKRSSRFYCIMDLPESSEKIKPVQGPGIMKCRTGQVKLEFNEINLSRARPTAKTRTDL